MNGMNGAGMFCTTFSISFEFDLILVFCYEVFYS